MCNMCNMCNFIANNGETHDMAPANAVRRVLSEAAKSLVVEVGEQDLQTLKTNGYNICFAKKVEPHSYNVIWQAYDYYLAENKMSWCSIYSLFGSFYFQDGEQVAVATNEIQIAPGEEGTLEGSGVLSGPVTGSLPEKIVMVNQYGEIHPGLKQLVRTPRGELLSASLFLTVDGVLKGSTSEMKPVEELLVWFEQGACSGMMFGSEGTYGARTKAIEIDMTGTSSATRLYENGAWVTP